MLRRKFKQETYVFFIDNDDAHIRDVLANFEERNEHNVKIYSRSREFSEDFEEIESSIRKIVIVFLATTLELDEENKGVNAVEILKRIKSINPQSEVILYSVDDDANIVSSAFKFGAYSFIKRNENIILRIENNIKGIISQKNFLLKKHSVRNITIIFLGFLLLLSVFLLILYFRFPHLFIF